MYYRILLFAAILGLWLQSCSRMDVYEKVAVIPGQEWDYSNKPSFTFHISDTASLYNIYVVLRHTDAYKYNNLWVKLEMQFPGDSMKGQNLDMVLGTDAKGWEGRGMDDIFEYRKVITPGPIPLRKAGDYTFRLSQIMRENPLEHILNVGVRVEKMH